MDDRRAGKTPEGRRLGIPVERGWPRGISLEAMLGAPVIGEYAVGGRWLGHGKRIARVAQ
jgi:hypothetical protein